MNWTTLFVTFALIIALVSGDAENEAAITDFLSFVNTSSPALTLEDADRLYIENCRKNAEVAAFDWGQLTKREVSKCMQSLFNEKDRDDMNAAENNQAFDMGFRKYCSSSAQFRQCVVNFTATVDPCLQWAAKERKLIIANVTDAVLNFVCYNDGARIAQFIEGEVVECVQQHEEDIRQCVNETMRINSSVDVLLGPALSAEDCKDLRALQRCVVPKLATCQKNATAEIAETLFNLTYEATPCANLPVLPVGLESQTEVPSDS